MKKVDKSNIENITSLSPMQEGMLFHYLREPESELYFEQLCLKISGNVNFKLFQETWQFIVETNEMLRTVFRWEKLKKPVQLILKHKRIDINYYDISDEDNTVKEKLIEEIKTKDKEKKFNLLDRPFRITLCKTYKEMYEMIISNHHILYDGWSTGIILKEFLLAYGELSNGRKLIKSTKNSFNEYVKYLKRQDVDKEKIYWKEYLKDYASEIIFSNKKKKGTVEHYSFEFSECFTNRLKDFIQKHKITLATLLYSTWGILLQKYSNNRDVVFGTTVSGRNIEIDGIENMVGMFINTVPLRVRTNKEDNALELIHKINKNLQERINYETTPLVDLKDYCGIDNKENLFDTVVVVENYPIDNILFSKNNSLNITSYSIYEQTNFDLVVMVENTGTIKITLSYKNRVFSNEMIEMISSHFCEIINKVLDEPNTLVEKVDMLTEKEKQEIIYDFNDKEVQYPKDKTIQELFEEQVEKTPDNIALIFEDKQLTYREVNERANSLAKVLKKTGVKPDTKVGIMVVRSIEMIVGIIGILKAGGAYVPMDPDYPVDRIEYMLEDSGSKILLTQSKLMKKLTFTGEIIDLENQKIYELDKTNLDKINNPEDLAYVIYTSGSTGKPKGVLIEHKSITNTLRWRSDYYKFNHEDEILQIPSFAFDSSVEDIFTPLISGAKLVLIAQNQRLNLEYIKKVLRKNKISHFLIVPSLYKTFLNEIHEDLKEVKKITVAGEICTSLLVEEHFNKLSNVKLYNEYGPTENSVCTTVFEFDKNNKDVSIGKPIYNSKCYILDKNHRIMPIGVAGELCISGIGLARGYLNRPELTKEKFVEHSFIEGKKMYKTGDLVRWRTDGNIEFIGRIDNQVKIRGYRIELSEIESILLKHKDIKEAVVITREDENKDRYICGYIVGEREFIYSELTEYLKNHLPEYMIPAYFVRLEKIPLTPNGKIDRKGLPKPDESVEAGVEYEAPRDYTEEILLTIWQEVLPKKKRIGVNDNFFEMGGHSIKAMQIIGQINKTFDIGMEINELFEKPTIRELARHISNSQKGQFKDIEKVEKNKYYELSYNQRKLWAIYQIEPENTAYNMTGRITLTHRVDKQALKSALEKIILRHESLRTGFKIIGNRPMQFIDDDFDNNLDEIDLSSYDEKTKKYKRELIFEKEKGFIFDISKSHLFRTILIKLDEECHELLFNMHHIVSDGWSIEILKSEFFHFYEGYRNDLNPELPTVGVQYKDFAAWHNKLINDNLMKTQSHEYWKNIFKKGIKEINLPYDFSIDKKNNESSGYVCVLSNEVKNKLKELAINNNLTLFAVMFSTFNLLLSKLSGQKEITCGIPSAGRSHISTQNTVGFFINSMILKNNIDYKESFLDLVNRININLLYAFKHQYYPLELVLQELKMRYPDVSAFFNMLNLPVGNTKEELKSFEGYHIEKVQNAKFNIVIYLAEYKNGIEVMCNYRNSVFKASTVEYIMKEYTKLINYFALNPKNSFYDYKKSGKKRIII